MNHLTRLAICIYFFIFCVVNQLKSPYASEVEEVVFKNSTLVQTTNQNTFENATDKVLSRGKRYLDILDGSRMFVRINVKDNVIKMPQIWAHAVGFRANLPILFEKKLRPYKRDTYELLHELMDKTGIDGQACILKAFCTAHMLDEDNIEAGMLMKLLKYIFTLDSDDKRYFSYLRMENCQQILHSHCPLSFNNISPYTDDV